MLDNCLASKSAVWLEAEKAVPPGVLREVCALLSLSQRAESAFKSSIIA